MAFKLGMCSHLAQVGVQSFPIVLGGHARAISQSFLNVSRPLCGQRLRNHTWMVAVSCWTSAATIGLHLSVRFFSVGCSYCMRSWRLLWQPLCCRRLGYVVAGCRFALTIVVWLVPLAWCALCRWWRCTVFFAIKSGCVVLLKHWPWLLCAVVLGHPTDMNRGLKRSLRLGEYRAGHMSEAWYFPSLASPCASRIL